MKKIHGQILLVLSFVLLLVGSYVFLPPSFDTAQAFGNLMGVSFLIFLMIKFFNRNKSDEAKDRGYVTLGVIAILWVGFVLYKEVNTYKNLNNFVSIIESGDTSRLESMSQNNIKVPGYSGNEAKDTEILLNVTLAAQKPYSLQIEKNEAELQKLGMNQVLSAQMFNNRSAIASGYQKIDKWAYFANEEARLINEAHSAQLASIDNTSIASGNKENFLKGLNKSFKEVSNFHKLKTAATLKCAANARQILKLAENNIGQVKVMSDVVIFPRQEDNQTYSLAVEELLKNAADEEKYAKAIETYQQEAINKMKRLLSK